MARTFGADVGVEITTEVPTEFIPEANKKEGRETVCKFVSDGVYKYVYADTGEDVE